MKATTKNQRQDLTPNLVELPKEQKIETTEPEHVRLATLYTLHSSFIGIDHHRKTGRMVGHEPGPENNF
jgi:hypothetical protein